VNCDGCIPHGLPRKPSALFVVDTPSLAAGRLPISVIIPVYREQDVINQTVGRVRALPLGRSVEIIVVDGSPDGETIGAIVDGDVTAIRSGKGRGRQMNAGAATASGDVLLFLHADTQLPADGLTQAAQIMENDDVVAGAYRLGIAAKGVAFRIIESIANLRSRLTRIPYGDQAIFIRKATFMELGGYREWPIMEEVDLMRRTKRGGGKICFVQSKVMTSARRWREEGIVACTLRNWTIMCFYLVGVSPKKLARWYK
jgi:rSAM/selenodomain-associated transferase 2